MSESSHLAYLSLGSNIKPEINLVRAVQLLQNHGVIKKISTAWESESVGAPGPNYLNACLCLSTFMDWLQLKEQILLPIEKQLGRIRNENRFVPRTMDIDVVLFDDKSCGDKYWEQAFVVIPLAEIYPTFQNPLTHEPIEQTAKRLRTEIWMKAHEAVLSQLNGSGPAA